MKKKKILVVDGDRTMRLAIAVTLKHHGYLFVSQAGDGKEGLTMIVVHQPDLIITSLAISEIQGEELIRLVKSNLPGIKIIALSEHNSELIKPAVKKVGADHFLAKPLNRQDRQELIRVVEALLAQLK